MTKYTQIIWDFNGTILNDVFIGVEAANALLGRHGKNLIHSVDEYQRAFCFPVIDYYEKIGLERENFDRYADEWVIEYNLREPEATVYPGIAELLTALKAAGYKQYLLSATEREMLGRQVQKLGIRAYFNELIGQDNTKAHGKKETALQWSKKVNLEDALMIGDSVHDFEVSQALRVPCVLLAYGHQDRTRLEACGCPVYDDAFALHKAFKNGEL